MLVTRRMPYKHSVRLFTSLRKTHPTIASLRTHTCASGTSEWRLPIIAKPETSILTTQLMLIKCGGSLRMPDKTALPHTSALAVRRREAPEQELLEIVNRMLNA